MADKLATHQPKKRDDLQCWRAVAILAVLLFHIWPNLFPNGYLGVDIFFLLSGYLMATLYSFDKNILKSIINFYYRRLKRILPIYLFVIAATLGLLARFIFPEEYDLIIEDSIWALKLLTNYQDSWKNRGYFDTESNYRFFRHCWSLAVEMQFYLIFPFIALARNYLTRIKYQFLLISILLSSLLYQAIIPNKIIQYESLFCRIWQFAFGMLAQTFSFISVQKWWLRGFLLLTTAIVFSSILLPQIFSSFIVLAMVAILISSTSTTAAENDPFRIFSPKIISNLVILGDISYILYLIHWPLITYSRLISISSDINFYNGTLLFVASISISYVAHKIIEKPLMKLCNNYFYLILIMLFLYASAIYAPGTMSLPPINWENENSSEITLKVWKNSLNFNSPMILPPEWTSQNEIEFGVKLRGESMGGVFDCIDRHSIQINATDMFLFCEVNGKNPNGNLTALLIGNSFSMNILAAVAANPLFSKAISVFGNSIPFPIHDEIEEYFMEELIKKIKPDVTFIVQRYYQKELWDTPIEKIEENKEFQHWKKIFKIIQNYTSAIILNKEQIIFPFDISQDYIRRKFYNLPIESRLKNPPKSQIMEEWFKKLDCPKCAWFDYREAFCEGEYCNTIDIATGLPVFRDTEHISIMGLRHLKPFIDAAINKVLHSN